MFGRQICGLSEFFKYPLLYFLLQCTTRRDRPDHLDYIVADADDPVKQVADDTAMIGDDRHPLTDIRP